MTSPAQAPRTVPPSRLFATLMAEAEQSTNRNAWARTVCRAAAHQARAGQAARALSMITSVRQVYGTKLHHDVAPWLMLAEGVLHWTKFELKSSYDRIIRAHALAAALKAESTASCAAWMAAICFTMSDFARMSEYLTNAYTVAGPKDHQARARAALVMADAYQFAGAPKQSIPWYHEAHFHITVEGDEAMLGAMLFNVGLFHLANIRLDDAFGARDEKEIIRARLEAGGSMSFDYMTANQAQPRLRLVLKTMQLMSEHKYEPALEILNSLDVSDITEGVMVPATRVDKAWCLFNVGKTDEALEIAQQVLQMRDGVKDTDDRAYVLARSAAILRGCGHTDAAVELQAEANDALTHHRLAQTKLLAMLEAIPATFSKVR